MCFYVLVCLYYIKFKPIIAQTCHCLLRLFRFALILINIIKEKKCINKY
ncbi:protein of unknown function [Methanocaldococcus lauensis]|uniref:Uncharacterized protein n=1 Tax=Methanocaldococcus lauensis TaxID=2546128 RepID=A0A8D6PQ14_9EURY|nr:protein of unknown function [Methanocaldococcus lauensis]CAB3290241.1 protein of unknown function [Methanocaldococcus lauensis]